jgi:hypothetical protein
VLRRCRMIHRIGGPLQRLVASPRWWRHRLSLSGRIVANRDISHLGRSDAALSAAMIRLSLYHHRLVVLQPARRAVAGGMVRICRLRIRASGALRACVMVSKTALPLDGHETIC